MTMWLKQSTTITLKMGPFLDKTDGVTEETALSPAVELSKNGGAFAARNSATAITHDANGWYAVEVNATDTNTLGRLQVKSDDAATHLPVWHEFMVVPANVYDSLVGGSDQLQVDTIQWAGAATATDDVALATAPANFAALSITAAGLVELSAAGVSAIWDKLTSALTTAGSIGKLLVDNVNATISSRLASASYTAPDNATITAIAGYVDTEVAAILAAVDTEIGNIQSRLPAALTAGGNMKSDALALNGSTNAAAQLARSAATIVNGAAVSGTLSTTQMTTDLTNAVDDHYNGRIIIFTSGVLQNQATEITDYDGATKRLTFIAITSAPSVGDAFIIV